MNRGNYQKTPLAESLARIPAEIVAAMQQEEGKALPCSVVAVNGSIVTVKFEVNAPQTLPQISIPKAESRWIRAPIQVGDYGVTMPADTYLGGISGLGGGVATLTTEMNLTALAFVPIASTSFPAVNVNAAYIGGPEGAVISTEDGSVSITVEVGQIVLKAAGKTWTFGSAGLTMSTGIVAETHGHISESPGTRTGNPIT